MAFCLRSHQSRRWGGGSESHLDHTNDITMELERGEKCEETTALRVMTELRWTQRSAKGHPPG